MKAEGILPVADDAFRRRCRRCPRRWYCVRQASGPSRSSAFLLVLKPATFTIVVTASLLPLSRLIPDSVPSFDTLVTLLFLVDMHVVVKPRSIPITY
jgi:hypothetical protein